MGDVNKISKFFNSSLCFITSKLEKNAHIETPPIPTFPRKGGRSVLIFTDELAMLKIRGANGRFFVRYRARYLYFLFF
jgi:hypothetical protein